MRGTIALVTALLLQGSAFAADSDPATTFNDAKALGNSLRSATVGEIRSGTAAAAAPSYTPGTSVPEADAYSSAGDGAITAKRLYCQAHTTDPTCAGLISGSAAKPRTYIKLDDPVMKGLSVGRDPAKYIGDFASSYNACTSADAVQTADAVYEDKTCALDVSLNQCHNKLTVVPKDVYNCEIGTWYQTLEMGGGSDKMWVQAYCMPPDAAGNMKFRAYAAGGKGACIGWQEFNINIGVGNGEVNVARLSPHWGGRCRDTFVYQSGAACASGKCTRTFRFDAPGRTNVTGNLTFDVPHVVKLKGDYWDDGCRDYQEHVKSATEAATSGTSSFGAKTCQMTSQVCVDGPSTKTIDGINVTRSCWDLQSIFNCTGASPEAAATCSASALANCKQVSAMTCTTSSGDTCSKAEVKFQCPVSAAEYSGAVNCGPSTFCPGGVCYDMTVPPNGDFAKSVSYLSAAAEIAKDLDMSTLKVFTGENQQCAHKLFGVLDCCDTTDDISKLTEIGDGIHDAFCPVEEQQLARLRAKGRCKHIGSYCAQRILGVCVKEKESYCCFNSKLARIINEGGKAQLGMSYGAPKSPDCSGFTIEQLQTIDFGRIDFSEFYADIKPIIPDPEGQKGQAGSTMPNCYYGAGKCQ